MKQTLALLCAIGAIGSIDDNVSAARRDQAARERIPPLVGGTENQARAKLKARGFTGTITVEITSPTVKCPDDAANLWPGLVCASTPGGGDNVPPDSEINLLIQGEHTVDEPAGLPPRVVGMSRDQAVTVLIKERFTNLVYQFVEKGTCAAGKVCGVLLSNSSTSFQNPDGTRNASFGSPGSRVPYRHYPLTLQIETAHPRGASRLNAAMIDIVGDTLDVALAKLDVFGVRGPIRLSGQSCPNDTAGIESGRICTQRPVAGQLTNGIAVEYALVDR